MFRMLSGQLLLYVVVVVNWCHNRSAESSIAFRFEHKNVKYANVKCDDSRLHRRAVRMDASLIYALTCCCCMQNECVPFRTNYCVSVCLKHLSSTNILAYKGETFKPLHFLLDLTIMPPQSAQMPEHARVGWVCWEPVEDAVNKLPTYKQQQKTRNNETKRVSQVPGVQIHI